MSFLNTIIPGPGAGSPFVKNNGWVSEISSPALSRSSWGCGQGQVSQSLWMRVSSLADQSKGLVCGSLLSKIGTPQVEQRTIVSPQFDSHGHKTISIGLACGFLEGINFTVVYRGCGSEVSVVDMCIPFDCVRFIVSNNCDIGTSRISKFVCCSFARFRGG